MWLGEGKQTAAPATVRVRRAVVKQSLLQLVLLLLCRCLDPTVTDTALARAATVIIAMAVMLNVLLVLLAAQDLI